MTAGYSPVMIEHILDEALVWALRRGANRLSWSDLQRAKMTEEIGLAQPVEYTEAERRTIATHESGHAVVAWLVGKGRKLEVLSIIKRSEALGLLAHSDLEERFLKSETELHALMQIAFGGMVAEEIFFGEVTTGPAGDLKMATTLAAQMVGSLGMAGSLFSYEAIEGPYANVVAKVASTDDGKAKVEDLLDRARDEVRVILTEHSHMVERLRDALLERERADRRRDHGGAGGRAATTEGHERGEPPIGTTHAQLRGKSGPTSGLTDCRHEPGRYCGPMADVAKFDELLEMVWDGGATDLLLTCGASPLVRVDGELVPLSTDPLTEDDTERLTTGVLNDEQNERFRAGNDIDFAFSWRGLARFRGNAFHQRGNVALSLRLIPYRIPSFGDLGAPPAVETLVQSPARPGPRHRAHRGREVHHLGGHDRLDQREPGLSHPDHRRPDRVHPHTQAGGGQPARDRPGHRVVGTGPQIGAPRGPGCTARGRDAGPRQHRHDADDR